MWCFNEFAEELDRGLVTSWMWRGGGSTGKTGNSRKCGLSFIPPQTLIALFTIILGPADQLPMSTGQLAGSYPEGLQGHGNLTRCGSAMQPEVSWRPSLWVHSHTYASFINATTLPNSAISFSLLSALLLLALR